MAHSARPAPVAAAPQPGVCAPVPSFTTGAPSPRQVEVLRFVAAYAESYGYPPSTHDLLALTGMRSTNGIREVLVALASKGLVRWEPRKARTLTITPAGWEVLR